MNNGQSLIKKHKFFSLETLLFVILFLYAISMILLVLWGLMTSLKTQDEFRKNVLWLPNIPTLEYYLTAFANMNVQINTPNQGLAYIPLGLQFYNSIVYSLGTAISNTISTCIVAYATAKFPFKKMNALILNIVIITMILPIVGSLPSSLQMSRGLGLYDTLWGPLVTAFGFTGLYYLIMLSFYKGLPDSFLEAAYIDGASEFQVLTKIAMPLTINIFSTIVLIRFVGTWQDYQSPMVFMPSHPTLAYVVYIFGVSGDTTMSHVPIKLAACFILLIPILILFIFFSDRLTGNIRVGGLKG